MRYLNDIAPFVDYLNRTDRTQPVRPQIDKALFDFANGWPLRYLHGLRLDITDLMSWTWILTADKPDKAVTRFILIRDSVYKRAVPMPNFIFTFLLRRHNITASGLKPLLLHAWSMMRIASISWKQSVKPIQQPYEPDPEVDAFRKVIPHVQEHGFGFQEDVFIVVVIRLLRRARSVWPAACESIVGLCCQYVNGLNFYKHDSEGPDPARLAFIYNSMLCLLALPASIQPFVSATHQQRAQFNLLRRMNQFNPPLVVDRRGYRAVSQLQLMHKKTLREREWAHLKAKSWPPWKENKLGIHAHIGPDDGISRAKEALNKAEEAGYASHGWERAASLLSGWDTDGSPSIQTRSVFLVPTIADESEDETGTIWANRILATRSLNEAWGVFQSYTDAQIRPYQAVYQAIFEKLLFDARRKERGAEDHPLHEGSEAILPGDGPEVFPPAKIPSDLVYVRTKPPSIDNFIDFMIKHDVKPKGKFLAALLINASSLSFGFRALLTSQFRVQDISALVEVDSNTTKSTDMKATLQELPTYLFDAFITMLTRCAPTHCYRINNTEDSSKLPPDIPFAPALPSNPLLHAFRVMRLRKPRNRRPWYSLLGALARYHVVIENDIRIGQDKQDIMSWYAIRKSLRWMKHLGVDLDFEGFMKLCVGLEKAVMAVEVMSDRVGGIRKVDIGFRGVAHDVLSKALPLVKEVFKNLVRSESMQQEIPKSLADVKAKIDEETEQHVADMEMGLATSTKATDAYSDVDDSEATDAHPEFENSPNERKNFLPPSCLLPRLLEIPRPAYLHQFVRVLGVRRDYDGLLDLIEWMALHVDDIDQAINEQHNGPRMFRRCLIATRVFLERSWTYYDIPDRKKHVLVEKDVEPAPKETWQMIRNVVEETENWGGWPKDSEVKAYVLKGRFI